MEPSGVRGSRKALFSSGAVPNGESVELRRHDLGRGEEERRFVVREQDAR